MLDMQKHGVVLILRVRRKTAPFKGRDPKTEEVLGGHFRTEKSFVNGERSNGEVNGLVGNTVSF